MKNHATQESGTALVVAMLLMLVLTIMLLGFYFVTTGEQKVAASNRDNEVTYYAAVAGLEQMSNLMANYFAHTASPTPAQIIAYTTTPSNFQSLNYTSSAGITYTFTSTYTLNCTAPGTTAMVLCSSVGNVLGSSSGAIGGNGPLAGLEGIITPFQLTVVADGPNNTEVKLTRTVQEVAVPIFEFGIFSDSDLSFHAGANFAFGGRVHTNGNLFLAEDGGSTLLLDDHVTAAKGIIRAQLCNGYVIQAGGSYSYTVDVLTATNGCPGLPPVPTGDPCRALALTEGSVVGGPGSAENSNWQSLSTTTYNNFIQDGTTGAKVLNLAIALPGINSQPIAMIQRPPASPPAATAESPTSALGLARFYNQASLRILLSDTQADIDNLPAIDTATSLPYPLAEAGSSGMSAQIQRTSSGSAYYLTATDALHPPLAESSGSTDSMFAAGTTVLGGYIKIEMQLQSSPGTWKDVTGEILQQGISRDTLTMSAEPQLTTGGSLSSGNTYYYVVTALGPYGTNNVAGESMGVEYGPYTTTSTNNKITIYWNPMPLNTLITTGQNPTGYRVYRGTTPGGEAGYIQYANTVYSYTESNAALTAGTPPTNLSIVHLEEAGPPMPAPGLVLDNNGGTLAKSTTYHYEVTAIGPWGETAGTQASIATGTNSKEEVTLNWTAVPNATGYRVYRTIAIDNQTTTGVFVGAGNGGLIEGVNCNWGTGSSLVSVPCTVNSGATVTFLDDNSPAPTMASPPLLPPGATTNSVPATIYPANFIPINMYDAREGEVRDTSGPTTSSLNGIMNLVETDVGNLQQWFAGNIATSGKYAYNGPDALNNSGYILYTSDRRMNCNDGQYDAEGNCASGSGETGEFGNEDIINPSVTSGAPNGVLDAPEDVDGDGVFRTYGAYAHPITTTFNNVSPTGVTVGGTATTATWSAIISAVANTATENPAFVRITANQAQTNSVVVFRRALRLVHGTLGNLPPLVAAQPKTATPAGTACSAGTAGGFTVASENPIYVQGDYNYSSAGYANPTADYDAFPLCHVPASVIGDAVTLLSNNWTLGAQPDLSSPYSGDANSFAYPTNPGCNSARCATTTYYRMAVMGGKTNHFAAYNGATALLTWGVQDTGTDGGAHNFLRYDEDWSNATLNYIGSMASFYLSRQDTGIYKCCNTVYNPPTRNYTFDTDFQSISSLPPGTPRFTDVNALSYYQSILASQ
jgi:Tfp pilus assembly protein PilX